MQTFILPQTNIHPIVDAITKRLGISTIYAFDYYCTNGQEHFFLLVLSPKASTGLGINIANAIAEQSDKKILTTILLHKPADLSSKQFGQQFFFDSVLRHGQRLALDKSNPPYVFNNNPKEGFEVRHSFWLKCEAVSRFHLNAAANHPHEGVGLCKIALLHTAVQQTALGIIRIFMAYTPNEYSLRYLLELYSHVTAAPALAFQNKTPDEVRLHKMLCTPPSMLNHRIKLHADDKDVDYLVEACENFIENAGKLADNKIEKSKNQK